MNFSSKGQYALEALFDLASQKTAEPVKIASIARRRKIPQKYLELILVSLKHGGFVGARRGVDGGYYLARPPESITVGEVLRFISGPPQKHNGRAEETAFSDLWRRVDKTVADIVDRANFAAIVRDWADKQDTYVHNWDI